MAASIARHHAEWLSLVEVSGPFLSLPVLARAFPQGLDAHDPEHLSTLRLAVQEWEDNWDRARSDPAIHRAWVRFVVRETLGLPDDVIAEGQALPPGLAVAVPEYGETLRPDLVVVTPAGDGNGGNPRGGEPRGDKPRGAEPRLLVQILDPAQDPFKPLAGHTWNASPVARMMDLLHGSGTRLGLVTNGGQWTLVNAPRGETTGYATWYTELWLDEPVTLRAFRSLLGVHRLFGVAAPDTLEALLDESAADQQEVTSRLGYQVRRAIEVLVQALDRSDKDRGRALLREVDDKGLYEAALTVMMRLVFLFSAEERALLLLGDPLYDEYYAVSTLRAGLRETADGHGEEALERRYDAWSRLLATFRAVHGGVRHDKMSLPAYGGTLFDPDRFPFLEGRQGGSIWRDTPALPLPIHNRTVLHLLDALQVLQVRLPGGGPAEARLLSFRALDIEQIGHVYESLLDHTAVRANEPVLGLAGSKDREPEVPLARLEEVRRAGDDVLVAFLKEMTGRSEKALARALAPQLEPDGHRLFVACDNDADLYERVRPFAALLRRDTNEYPVVIAAGSVYVTQGSDRRTTGTHYTPRSLTEPIVQRALEPVVYAGPTEGAPREDWRLKGAADLLSLKVCDMAMGSGAFLVQACRYLAARLVEAWEIAERAHSGHIVISPEGELSQGTPDEEPLPRDPAERELLARRLVADRCLYGVDVNHVAVEMAKLSLWLVTLQKNRPFTFLDHALRWGDALLGVDLEQLRTWQLSPGQGTTISFMAIPMQQALTTAIDLRRRIEGKPDRDVRDIAAKERLLAAAEEAMALARLGGDALVGAALAGGSERDQEIRRDGLLTAYTIALNAAEEERAALTSGAPFAGDIVRQNRAAVDELRAGAAALLGARRPFHWPLEFPEVFVDGSVYDDPRGFDAIVGNPPFLGGKRISGPLGSEYREYLVEHIAGGVKGNADLCAYFFLRARQLTRPGGGFGLLATNTIAQGDTREVGLDQLVAQGSTIAAAVPSRKWPGTANLEVAHVWVRRGRWTGPYLLDDAPAAGITPFLTPPGAVQGTPYRLAANSGKSFIGSYVLGMGFVLSPEEAGALIEKDARNRDVLFPYLNGEDLNSRPDQSPSRWVINFHDWPLERAQSYPDCMRIVLEKVKPQRETGTKFARKEWWLYHNNRPNLYATIAGMERVLVIAEASRTGAFSFAPNNQVFSHMLIVLTFDKEEQFAVLQSSFHINWAWAYASSLKGDLRYTPSDVFETMPFPQATLDLTVFGQHYYTHRQAIMLARQEGLTRTYNRFHDPDEMAGDIARLRELHVEMDYAVASAYGWDDLDLDHGFHETRQGRRYTISEAARREALGRLLALNHARYAEEVRLGLHDKGARKATTGGKKGVAAVAQAHLAL